MAGRHFVADAEVAFVRDPQVPINLSAFAAKLKNAALGRRLLYPVGATWRSCSPIDHQTPKAPFCVSSAK